MTALDAHTPLVLDHLLTAQRNRAGIRVGIPRRAPGWRTRCTHHMGVTEPMPHSTCELTARPLRRTERGHANCVIEGDR